MYLLSYQRRTVYIFIYVDDCLIAGTSNAVIKKYINEMDKTYKLKNQELADFLGFEIKQNFSAGEVSISASKYIAKTLREFDFDGLKPMDTPFSSRLNKSEEPFHDPTLFKQYRTASLDIKGSM